jgi:hypothetical protein
LTRTGLSWSQIKAAYAAREKRYGLREQDWNALGYIAVNARDRETTREALSHIDGKWNPGIWRSKRYFDDVFTWAQVK